MSCMADKPDVKYDTIVVPEQMLNHPAQAQRLAEQKAKSLVGPDECLVFVHLGTAYPVGGEDATEVEWGFTYRVVPPGGGASATAR
jgi:hypothetical protein